MDLVDRLNSDKLPFADLLGLRYTVVEKDRVAAELARISQTPHGLRGAVRPTGQERRAARSGTTGKRLDAPCRPGSAALRVAPRRPTAASRPSTVAPLRFSVRSWRIGRLDATQAVGSLRNAG